MESVDPSRAPAGENNWEVYRDALAPAQNTHRPRPWERIPVPAHAHRLQGQRIWKKAGLQTREDKENDSASLELQSEGKGARKRQRAMGAKENIGDATWKSTAEDPTLTEGDTKSGSARAVAPAVQGAENLGVLQHIPRKRTNTDHVITPRKPLRQTSIHGHLQAQSRSPGSPATNPATRRKSTRQSLDKTAEPTTSTDAAPLTSMDDSATSLNVMESLTEETVPVFVARRSTGRVSNTFPTSDASALSESNQEHEARHAALQSVEESTNSEVLSTSKVVQTPKRKRTSIRKGTRRSTRTTRASSAKAEDLLAGDDMVRQRTDAQSLDQPDPNNAIASGPSSGGDLSELANDRLRSNIPVEDTPRQDIVNSISETVSYTEGQSMQPQEERPNQGIQLELEVAALDDTPAVLESESHPTTGPITSLEPWIELGVSTMDVEQAQTLHLGALESLAPEPDTPQSDRDFEIPPARRAEQIAKIVGLDYAESVTNSTGTLGSPTILADVPLAEEDFEVPPVAGRIREVSQPPELGEVEELPPIDSSSPDSSTMALEPQVQETFEVHQARQADQITEPDPQLDITLSTQSSPARVVATTGHESPNPDPEDEITEILDVEIPVSPLDDSALDVLEPTLDQHDDETLSIKPEDEPIETNPEEPMADSTMSMLVETIAENAPSTGYDNEDTDMLRNFLTRVKANKAAKAEKAGSRKQSSQPHSPLRLPLGDVEPNTSPSPQKRTDEFDVGSPAASPVKRAKRRDPSAEEANVPEPKPVRRSGRTRLPLKQTPLGAPSLIPVRRLGQDGDTTMTLRRSEEKELVALTRVNTRKNKGALSPAELLIAKADEKGDPALRQRLLKEVFDDRKKGRKGKRGKSVAWAEELAQYQTMTGDKSDANQEKDKADGKGKKGAVRVGVRSKVALGMAVNGTPAPKRRMRERG